MPDNAILQTSVEEELWNLNSLLTIQDCIFRWLIDWLISHMAVSSVNCGHVTGRDFFQNEKNAYLIIGSEHGEMLIKFLTKKKKKKIKSDFLTNLWSLHDKIMKTQSWSDLRKGEREKTRFFRGPDREERTARR